MKAKDIILRPIPAKTAREVIRKHHYSGKVVNNSNLHIGVYLNSHLEGALQYGPPLDKRKLLALVPGTPWGGVLELNRMAFSEQLPKNSESRALAISLKLIRRHAPQVDFVVSFADATQSGDGTIYRAAGFDLTGIKPSDNLARFPNGTVAHKMTFESSPTRPRPEANGRTYYEITGGRYAWRTFVEETGGEILPGFQLRYIKFLNPDARNRFTAKVLPYSAIKDAGAGMYRGEKR